MVFASETCSKNRLLKVLLICVYKQKMLFTYYNRSQQVARLPEPGSAIAPNAEGLLPLVFVTGC